jgi:hypothetical protein
VTECERTMAEALAAGVRRTPEWMEAVDEWARLGGSVDEPLFPEDTFAGWPAAAEEAYFPDNLLGALARLLVQESEE